MSDLDRTAINEALTSAYMLVSLTTSQLPMTSTDATETQAVTARTSATDGAARVVKNIWGDQRHLIDNIHSSLRDARTAHYEFTLPWVTSSGGRGKSGTGLLANVRFMDYGRRMSAIKTELDAKMAALGNDYSGVCARARQSLGTMGSTVDYPDWTALKAKVGISITYDAVPAVGSMAHLSLPAGVVARLGEINALQQERAAKTAIKACWENAIQPLATLVANCSKDKTRIHESLLGNIKQVVDAMEAFNINKDPRMDQIRQDISALLMRYSTEDLRKDPKTRKAAADDAAKQLKAVEDVLSNLPW